MPVTTTKKFEELDLYESIDYLPEADKRRAIRILQRIHADKAGCKSYNMRQSLCGQKRSNSMSVQCFYATRKWLKRKGYIFKHQDTGNYMLEQKGKTTLDKLNEIEALKATSTDPKLYLLYEHGLGGLHKAYVDRDCSFFQSFLTSVGSWVEDIPFTEIAEKPAVNLKILFDEGFVDKFIADLDEEFLLGDFPRFAQNLFLKFMEITVEAKHHLNSYVPTGSSVEEKIHWLKKALDFQVHVMITLNGQQILKNMDWSKLEAHLRKLNSKSDQNSKHS